MAKENHGKKQMQRWDAKSPMMAIRVCIVSVLLHSILFMCRFEVSDVQRSLFPVELQKGVDRDHDELSNGRVLSSGDLPGYTGWVRPSETLAGWFEVLENAPATVAAGNYWNVSVICRHPLCQQGGALFYIRAYGRSVLPGEVHDHRDGIYDISIMFADPGPHVVEVVLTFSTTPGMDKFPLDTDTAEPGYEGYLLPGFPLTVTVTSETIPASSRRCGLSDLTSNSTRSAIDHGRWLVVTKQASRRDRDNTTASAKLQAVREGYQSGLNSIGIQMEYVPYNCLLPQQHDLREELLSSKKTSRLHVVFIGDSNMIKQHRIFDKLSTGMPTTLISTSEGLVVRLPEIQESLRLLQEKASPNEKFMILFNAGLHDISLLCSRKWSGKRVEYIHDSVSCGEHYRQSLIQLVDLIRSFPAELAVFQTTTAGWIKWGNFGFAWDPARVQTLPLDTSSCAYFNEIAWSVMKEADIPVLDSYWLTLARPDHRESGDNNAIGAHLVHAGPQVYDSLVRQWVTTFLDWCATRT
jgi:hypothetical protein